MAIEIMLLDGKSFCHDLRHDLESVLYVIIWICTHMTGVESEHEDIDDLDIRQWCGLETPLRALGLLKLSHISAAKVSILPQLASYWTMMKPSIQQLISEFFPFGPSEPNNMSPENMLALLKQTKSTILAFESLTPGPVLALENLAPAVKVQGDTLSHHYVTLENGKRYRLGQDAVIMSNTHAKNESQLPVAGARSDKRGARKAGRNVDSWQDSVQL